MKGSQFKTFNKRRVTHENIRETESDMPQSKNNEMETRTETAM
jgi:hypothetical protein